MKKNITELKKIIIESSAQSKEGHIPSALSILDILWVLYDKVLKINFNKPKDLHRDFFILSKGHASLGLYSILANKNFFSFSELKNFGKFKSILGGHPDKIKIPGVEASTGSLGHGLPISVGIALGLKIKKLKNKVFVIVGDGECNEGTIWEASMLAAHHNLSNLTCIIDHNHSTDRALKIDNLSSKFKSFGWDVLTIDGHNQKEIYMALSQKHKTKPRAIIAKTIKGYGVKMMENNPEWHHKFPNPDELTIILKELR